MSSSSDSSKGSAGLVSPGVSRGCEIVFSCTFCVRAGASISESESLNCASNAWTFRVGVNMEVILRGELTMEGETGDEAISTTKARRWANLAVDHGR
jgi:hypothetical protein